LITLRNAMSRAATGLLRMTRPRAPRASGVALALLCFFVLPSHAQLTTNVYDRVLMIRVGTGYGTGFTLDVDGRQYLVTAKHVVAGLAAEGTLLVYRNDAWMPVQVKVFRSDDPVDIAVLVAPTQLTVSLPLEATKKGLRYGQDMYFAGFPYQIHSTAPALNGGYPVAFVKKAIMSGEVMENGASVILLDGYNNPGFSGGPLLYRDLDRTAPVFKVAGVVKGFRAELTPIYKKEEIAPDQVTRDDIAQERIIHAADGRTLRLSDTGEVMKLNTDILIGYNISYALDLIRKNPIGPLVSDKFHP
jgi:Trypsin-like peptidase domain